MRKTKNLALSFLPLWAFVPVMAVSLLIAVPSASAQETGIRSSSACEAAGGTCNSVFRGCGSDKTEIGVCEGLIFTSSCCRENNAPNNGGNGGGNGSNNSDGGDNGGGGNGGGAATSLTYTPLEKIPFLTETTGDLASYFQGIYRLALVLIVLSAIFMLIVGGFMYLTSGGNTSRTGNAKGIIKDALLGLVLALAAVLILRIINPDLTNLSINALSPVSIQGGGAPNGGAPSGGGGGGGSFTAAQTSDVYTDAQARELLKNAGVGVNKANCTSAGQTNCTSLDNIPKSTIDFVIHLRQDCGCGVVVTGGTEAGHQTHGPNRAVVDLRRAPIANFIQRQPVAGSSGGRKIYSYRGYKVWDENSEHFHAFAPAN
jgi:hypothetical protein